MWKSLEFHREKAFVPFTPTAHNGNFTLSFQGTGWSGIRMEPPKSYADDAFIFEPGQPHQLTNNGSQDLIMLIVADNPIGESCYYPDSQKWLVRSPESRMIRSDPLDYYEAEE